MFSKLFIVAFVLVLAGHGHGQKMPKFIINILLEGMNVTLDESQICPGVVIGNRWALAAAKCLVHLLENGDKRKLVAAAGNDPQAGPAQVLHTEETITTPGTGDISLIKFTEPVKESEDVEFAKLPPPDFKICSKPMALETKFKTSARGFGFLLGLVCFGDPQIVMPMPPPVMPPEMPPIGTADSEYGNAAAYPPPPGGARSGPILIESKSMNKDKKCRPGAGTPLMCDNTVVGVEVNCKPLKGDGGGEAAATTAATASTEAPAARKGGAAAAAALTSAKTTLKPLTTTGRGSVPVARQSSADPLWAVDYASVYHNMRFITKTVNGDKKGGPPIPPQDVPETETASTSKPKSGASRVVYGRMEMVVVMVTVVVVSVGLW